MAVEDNKEKRTLFRRLTKLFRTSPVVRRKIKGQDTTIAVPDNTKSSGALLFQKAATPSYAAITGNAYSLAERLPRFQDYNAMEDTSEISAMLDIVADETVAVDEKGVSLHIFSNDEKIKSALDDLFNNVLNIEFNLRPWARNLAKFGDVFLLTDVHPEHGVIRLVPIPINEIEREENYDRENPFAVRFRWVTLGNRVLENWEVAHMRLLGNDAFIPYGSSMIEAARKTWRQLLLAEDAMLVYRVVRAPERRVFYIDVGNLAAEEVDDYMQKQKQQLRTSHVIDRATGRVDLRYNPLNVEEDYFLVTRGNDTGTKIDTLAGGQNAAAIDDVLYLQRKLISALKTPRAYLGYEEDLSCLVGETKIKLLDGTSKNIQELAELFTKDPNTNVYVYSSTSEGEIVPGKVTKAWKTKDVTELFEIELDDGSKIRATDNHPFMLRDGTFMRADQLTVEQSLMPLYTKQSSKEKGDLLEDYEMIFDNKHQDWFYTHKNISDFVNENRVDRITKTRVVHHVDFNKHNNNPDNLQEMTWMDHRNLHSKHVETTLLRPDVIEKAKKARLIWLKSDKHRDLKRKQIVQQITQPGGGIYEYQHSQQFIDDMTRCAYERWEDPEYRALKTRQNKEILQRPEVRAKIFGDGHWSRRRYEEYDIEWLVGFCKQNNVAFINQWQKEAPNSVFNISPCKHSYVNSLIKRNGYKDWRDFAEKRLGLKIKGRGIGATVNGKVYDTTARYYNHKIVSITRVCLSAPVAVYDLEVEDFVLDNDKSSSHNFAIECNNGAIFVHNSKSSLAQLDIRFSRTISIVQKTIISELNKVALIHLFALGFRDEELKNFTLHLSNPSTVAQQQKLELWRAKAEIANSFPDGAVSMSFLRKEILGLTPDQIKNIDIERLREKVIDLTIESAGPKGGGEGGSGGGGGGGGGSDLFGDTGGGGAAPGGEEGGLPGLEGGGETGGTGGGEEPTGGGEAPEPNEEEPGEENAADRPEDEEDDSLELLTSAEDKDDRSSQVQLKLKTIRDLKSPVNTSKQIKRAQHNAERRKEKHRNTGRGPDQLAMLDPRDHSAADVHDAAFLKSFVTNPLGEDAELSWEIHNLDRLDEALSREMNSLKLSLAQREMLEALDKRLEKMARTIAIKNLRSQGRVSYQPPAVLAENVDALEQDAAALHEITDVDFSEE